LYATELIGQSDFIGAVRIFEQYGAAANLQNFNIYKRLIDQLFGTPHTNTADAYPMWSSLRNMLLSLNEHLKEASRQDYDTRFNEVSGHKYN
jgi:hypothetical protein